MLNIGSWSFARVLGVSTGWIALALVFYAVRTYFQVQRFEGEGAGVAAVSVGLGPIVLVLLGPPMALFVIWVALELWARATV